MKFKLIALAFLLFAVPSPKSWAVQSKLAAGQVPSVVRSGRVVAQSRLAATNELRLAIGLPLHHQDQLQALLRDLYNPASTNYHHYLTPAQFTARFGPTAAEYESVLRFAGINHLRVAMTYSNRLVLSVAGVVPDVERAFHVQLKSYRHPKEPRNFFAPDREPTVDGNLPVQEVRGLENYELPKPRLPAQARVGSSPRVGSGPSGSYFGSDFRQAYVPGTALTGSGQVVGLFQLDGYDPADITNYAALAGQTNIPLQNVLLDGFDGTPSGGGGEIEVSLDIEMTMSMAPGLAKIIVYEGYQPLDVLDQMAADDAAAQLSCSWGWSGGPSPTMDAVFQEMAAQGQSFFEASGDLGAYLPGSMDDPATTGTPSDNPWLTCVGGTTLTMTGTGGGWAAETAWNYYDGNGSGGGASGYYALPYWQAGVSMVTNSGAVAYRNIPDVAMVADDVWVIHDSGTASAQAGTSCAAPLWAGYMALVNQQAAQLGQPAVGFLNPALYAICRSTNYGTAFNDITNGDSTTTTCPTNYYAVAGYDLCTGWGSPNGTNLINLLTLPDYLGLPAGTNLASAGPVGGPFSATNWTVVLTNTGPASLVWAAGNLPAWLTVTPAGGTLATNGSVTLTLSLAGAAQLLPNTYAATLTVTNVSEGRVDIAALVTLAVNQSIVLNGGFEMDNFTDWTFVGDTVIGSNIYNGVGMLDDFPDIVHSGYYGALLGEYGYLATLSQTLPTTPGQLYLVSCWLQNSVAGTNQEFAVSWGGTNRVDWVNPPAFTWTNICFTATAAGTNTVLEFGAQNDPNYFGFDDVAVTPVPPVTFSGFTVGTNAVQLSWISLPVLNYQVQYATNLNGAVWTSLGGVTATTNVTSLLDTNAPAASGARFYRLELLP